MINVRVLAFTILVGLGSTHPAKADSFIDGNELYDKCRSSRVFCQAYIMGIAEVIGKQTDAMKEEGMMICMPEGTRTEQLIDVVTASLKNNPADRTMPAHYLVMNALTNAWRCPK